MGPTILPFATGGVNNSASGVYSSVVGGLRNETRNTATQWLLVAKLRQWQFSAVFGGADNEANNTAAVATGGVGNSASGVCSWSASLRNEP
jgi:hypothetical protein